MSWWSWLSGGAASLGSDIYDGFHGVYTSVVGDGQAAINEAEKVGGQIASDASGFTTSIFLNWFFSLIVYPIVNAVEWVMIEIVSTVMKGVGIFIGLIFAIPDGLTLWFENHIISVGIASPIALSLAIGIILIIAIGIGLALAKILQMIIQEA